jgi:dTDP-4-dehydrorhamnose 3,5-epimerase-like enzyme
VDPRAACDVTDIGDGVTVAAFAVVGAGVVLAEGVTIGEGAIVVGGQATEIGQGARVGANATILPGVAIGRGAVVEPGTVVADAVPPNAIVRGNPARIVGYVDAERTAPAAVEGTPAAAQRDTRVPGVERHPLTRVNDLRGTLAVLEATVLPFAPQRIFSIFDVPSELLRGAHAHRQCSQFLICLTGSVRCVVDDGRTRDEIELTGADFGLLVPPMVWSTQYGYTRDAVLLVVASHLYDPDDYIRDYDEFLEAVLK